MWKTILIIVVGLFGLIFVLNKSGLERNVRACLENSNRYTGDFHHIYLTDVVSADRMRTFPDGTAMRTVKYHVENSNRVHSTTCTW